MNRRAFLGFLTAIPAACLAIPKSLARPPKVDKIEFLFGSNLNPQERYHWDNDLVCRKGVWRIENPITGELIKQWKGLQPKHIRFVYIGNAGDGGSQDMHYLLIDGIRCVYKPRVHPIKQQFRSLKPGQMATIVADTEYYHGPGGRWKYYKHHMIVCS